jgi:cysteine desulfuration protein SufE
MTVDELKENFDLFDDWEEKYVYLIDLGKKLEDMPAELKNDTTRVEGCLSQVWYVLKPSDDDRLHFLADSDSVIVRGLIAVLLILYNGRNPADIDGGEAHELFDSLGFGNHISSNRRNGFAAMVGRIEALAKLRAK